MCMVKDMGIDTLGHKTWGQGWENKGNAYAHGDRKADREGTELASSAGRVPRFSVVR